MSYTINKLSAIKVRSVTRPGMYGDGAGLWLQVSKGGAKSWIFRYDFCGRFIFGGTDDRAISEFAYCVVYRSEPNCQLVCRPYATGRSSWVANAKPGLYVENLLVRILKHVASTPRNTPG